MTEQEIRGCKFDLDNAHKYLEQIGREKEKYYSQVRELLEPIVVCPGKEVSSPYKLDGKLAERTKKYLGEEPNVGGPFTPVRFDEPDLGSNKKLIAQLEKYGWEPTEWTDKGNPRITEDSLENLEREELKVIATWSKLDHKESQIQGLVDNVRENHRIPASVIALSTNTGRVSHRIVANIPKANKDEDGNLLWYPEGKKIFGTEMRSLFTVEDGRKMVGVDASGLEMRILAHYINDENFTRELLEGDIHIKMLDACYPWVEDRSTQKNVLYSMVYGAGDFRMGVTAGYPSDKAQEAGKQIRKRMKNAVQSLAKLTEKVEKASRRGYLIGLDGRKVWMRRNDKGVLTYKALNTLIQSAGIIVIKTATCYQDMWIKQAGIDAFSVLHLHDEAQIDSEEEHANDVANFLEKSISKAGTFYGLRCPLEGEAVIGNGWHETH